MEYRIALEDAVKSSSIPYFLLQPLVENAVKYGYNEEEETIDIELKIGQENKNLLIQLYDKGKPFKEDLNSGYGLKSVMKKLQLLFPEQHNLEFINEPNKHLSIKILDLL